MPVKTTYSRRLFILHFSYKRPPAWYRYRCTLQYVDKNPASQFLGENNVILLQCYLRYFSIVWSFGCTLDCFLPRKAVWYFHRVLIALHPPIVTVPLVVPMDAILTTFLLQSVLTTHNLSEYTIKSACNNLKLFIISLLVSLLVSVLNFSEWTEDELGEAAIIIDSYFILLLTSRQLEKKVEKRQSVSLTQPWALRHGWPFFASGQTCACRVVGKLQTKEELVLVQWNSSRRGRKAYWECKIASPL